ncbi:c6 transcription [Diplodia corticola]|uniref:C6 transcription n=1 Tax=Diplodia corticola TaxID=236234 RepID=A0A1J9REL3_9PEZI|nr:c6 transcription [Diplodia corticola]OJD38849.1 c6 transcription [Diplodia corticola]
MDAFANPSAQPANAPPSAAAAQSSGGTRQRIITSCLTCRRRKVKCDHKYPVCSACSRGNHVCYYANVPNQHQHDGRSPPSAQPSANRVHKHASSQSKGQSGHAEINARLERLESLLELAVNNQPPTKLSVNTAKQPSHHHPNQPARRDTSQSDAYESKERAASSASPNSTTSGDIQAADAYDGTLLVENGQSHFVSSLHWALLTEELQDIKAILSTEGKQPGQVNDSTAWGGIRTSQSLLFSSGQAAGDTSVFMPDTQEECFELFAIFIQNVDPVSRLVHKPSLGRRFAAFTRRWQNLTPSSASARSSDNFEDHWNEEQLQNFEPLAYAIFYSALNSLKAEVVQTRFRKDKLSLLRRYQQGLEFSLQQADFLTTSSIEVLQAFIIYLTVQAREDDMGQVWPLTGVAIRIAMLQGLHREPSFFTSSMDEVQVEIRRRMWHQICHLDWRASEGKGMEPTISDDDFTTLLPRNVSDSDLLEGRPPPTNPYLEEEGVTDMALQLCRLSMIQCFRKIAQNAYRLDRKCKDSRLRNSNLDIVPELQALFEETKRMVDEVHTKNERCTLRYCRLDVTVERMTIGLSANLEWRCWLIFWSGVPKDLRRVVINDDVRTMILTRSVSLIESLNRVSHDKDAEQFQWHIGGHAAFQAIMHILAELRDPEFSGSKDPIIRSRALRALHTVLGLKGRSESNTWAVIKRMVDRLDPNHEHAKPGPMSGISKERFGEDELSVMYFAKSPSPAASHNVSQPSSIKSPPQSQVSIPAHPSTQAAAPAPPPVATPTAVSQQDYAFFSPAQVTMPGSDMRSSIDARYQSGNQSMAGYIAEMERGNAGMSEANTSAWLQDMAMDMDWASNFCAVKIGQG